mmetsp:Transcript_12999/g.30732  ORF Transcript_12999/g.30732 Transcript_12999/m.30732 type:complete len:249 (+) Transcript_12999:1939-2685(+)
MIFLRRIRNWCRCRRLFGWSDSTEVRSQGGVPKCELDFVVVLDGVPNVTLVLEDILLEGFRDHAVVHPEELPQGLCLRIKALLRFEHVFVANSVDRGSTPQALCVIALVLTLVTVNEPLKFQYVDPDGDVAVISHHVRGQNFGTHHGNINRKHISALQDHLLYRRVQQKAIEDPRETDVGLLMVPVVFGKGLEAHRPHQPPGIDDVVEHVPQKSARVGVPLLVGPFPVHKILAMVGVDVRLVEELIVH